MHAMRNKKNKSTFDFGEVSDDVRNASKIFQKKNSERAIAFAENWPQQIPYDAEFEIAKEILAAESVRRMDIIRDHYRIANGPYSGTAMAIRLAMDFVPEFNPFSARRGRPKSVFRKHETLANEIEAIMDEGNKSLSNACKILSSRKGWRNETKETLEANYHRYKESVVAEIELIEWSISQLKCSAGDDGRVAVVEQEESSLWRDATAPFEK
jgi:hypothetical protein